MDSKGWFPNQSLHPPAGDNQLTTPPSRVLPMVPQWDQMGPSTQRSRRPLPRAPKKRSFWRVMQAQLDQFPDSVSVLLSGLSLTPPNADQDSSRSADQCPPLTPPPPPSPPPRFSQEQQRHRGAAAGEADALRAEHAQVPSPKGSCT